MRLMSKEQLRQFIKENNLKSAQEAQNALKELFAETLQEMLEAELDDNLGYAKNDTQNKQTSNRRNGHSKKTVRSEYGEIDTETRGTDTETRGTGTLSLFLSFVIIVLR